MLNCLTLSVVGFRVLTPFFAWLSDRVGRRTLHVPATILTGVAAASRRSTAGGPTTSTPAAWPTCPASSASRRRTSPGEDRAGSWERVWEDQLAGV